MSEIIRKYGTGEDRGRRERIDQILSNLPSAKPGEIEELRAYIDDNESRIKKAEELALTDELTGLGNRRGYDQRLDEAVDRYRRKGGPLAVIRIDCDGLSDANEMSGFKHRAGDIYIREVARAIKHSIRNTDYAARVGGDEFAVVVEGDEAATIVAKRIQQNLGLRIDKLKAFVDKRKTGNISRYFEASALLNKSGMSIGIANELYQANLRRNGLSGRELDRLADDAACAVKEAGGKAGTGVFRRENGRSRVYVEAAPYARQRKEVAGKPISATCEKGEDGVFRSAVPARVV